MRSIRSAIASAVLALTALFAMPASAAAPPHAPSAGLHIEVSKSQRQLRVLSADSLLHAYRIGLGSDPLSPKRREGDRATPEGRYFISQKNPNSKFFLSLAVSYPGIEDAERGLRDGLINKAQHDAIVAAIRAGRTPLANTALGGEIFVHGRGSASDWTWGCIALDDADMRVLFDTIAVGTPIVIAR